MKNMENKRLYAEDCKHSSTPGIYWQGRMKNCGDSWGDFSEYVLPDWDDNVDYRRKPDAPVWTTKQVDIIGRLTEFMRPTSKYGHIKRGNKVIANNGLDNNYYRLYVYDISRDGNSVICYSYGADEWSTNGQYESWVNCKLWDEIND